MARSSEKEVFEKQKFISIVKQPEDSQFWVGLMHVIDDLFPREREIQT